LRQVNKRVLGPSFGSKFSLTSSGYVSKYSKSKPSPTHSISSPMGSEQFLSAKGDSSGDEDEYKDAVEDEFNNFLLSRD